MQPTCTQPFLSHILIEVGSSFRVGVNSLVRNFIATEYSYADTDYKQLYIDRTRQLNKIFLIEKQTSMLDEGGSRF